MSQESTLSTHLVSAFATPDFGGETVRIGDLNGDGAPDLLYTQCIFGQRSITCLTAVTLSGEILWQVGAPSEKNTAIYGDLPVAIYDWDNDGRNEVLYVRQAHYAEPVLYDDPPAYRDYKICERALRYEGDATMVVLDGMTGREKYSFPIPAPADSSFLFADLTGRGRREDLVVKDEYWNMWGVSHEGKVLWHWQGSTGHCPAVADVDGDGCEEVFIGYALIDHDGAEIFNKHWEGWGDGKEDPWGVPHHQDATYIVRLADGSWRLLFGNGGVHCLAVDGTELWHHPLQEAQHVVAGNYRDDSEIQVAVIDRGYPRTPEGKPADLLLYDIDGREIWRRTQNPGGWCAACMDIRWSGNLQDILVYKRGYQSPIAIYNGQGDVVDEIEVPDDILNFDGLYPGNYYCCRADLWGDSREEVLVFGEKGMRIHANRRPLAIPTLYNNTLYHGM
ncbi:MAG: hypothetical protein ACYDCO_17870 [Armatimonadota bacterium]